MTICEGLAFLFFALFMGAAFGCLVLYSRLEQWAQWGERMRCERNHLAAKITTYRRRYYRDTEGKQ